VGCINFLSSVPIYVYRTWKISPLEFVKVDPFGQVLVLETGI